MCDVVHQSAHVANIWYNERTMHEQFPSQPSQLEPTGEITPPTPKRARAIGALASRVTELIAGARERRSARKLEKYKRLTEPNRYWAVGQVGHDVAYGLSRSSSDLVVAVPTVYPTSPALQADHRQVLKEMNDPGYHDRIQRMLDSIDDNDKSLPQEAL